MLSAHRVDFGLLFFFCFINFTPPPPQLFYLQLGQTTVKASTDYLISDVNVGQGQIFIRIIWYVSIMIKQTAKHLEQHNSVIISHQLKAVSIFLPIISPWLCGQIPSCFIAHYFKRVSHAPTARQHGWLSRGKTVYKHFLPHPPPLGWGKTWLGLLRSSARWPEGSFPRHLVL